MTDKAISPLRLRMTEDMTVRGFTACTQRGYIAAVRDFTVFLGCSPDQATTCGHESADHIWGVVFMKVGLVGLRPAPQGPQVADIRRNSKKAEIRT